MDAASGTPKGEKSRACVLCGASSSQLAGCGWSCTLCYHLLDEDYSLDEFVALRDGEAFDTFLSHAAPSTVCPRKSSRRSQNGDVRRSRLKSQRKCAVFHGVSGRRVTSSSQRQLLQWVYRQRAHGVPLPRDVEQLTLALDWNRKRVEQWFRNQRKKDGVRLQLLTKRC